jgi:hypothetical protein
MVTGRIKEEGWVSSAVIMERMLNEAARSGAEFQAPPQMRVSVLCGGLWSVGLSLTKNLLVPELSCLAGNFETSYAETHPSRRLSWSLLMGSVQLAMRPASPYISSELSIVGSPLQASILMMLGSEPQSVSAICTSLTSSDSHLPLTVACLQSLCFVGLVSQGDGGGFSLRPDFSSPKKKIILPLLRTVPRSKTGPSPDPQKENTPSPVDDSALDQERYMLCEAAIVRILKARRSCLIDELYSDAASLLRQRFVLSKSLFKKSLEGAMNLGYVARDDTNSSLVSYLA